MSPTLKNKIASGLLKIFASDSPLRKRLSDPGRIIQGAGVQPGQKVLEVGYGRGFFTLPLAQALGPDGCLYALDITDAAVDYVTGKLAAAGLSNVRFLLANALDTRLPSSAVDLVLLFGVIPSPTLPLSRLLPELQRVLHPDGSLAVWTAVPGWSPKAVVQGGLFAYLGKLNNVHKFRRL
jgi:ubiquinone/menaquinone biosynthesis C-methylase UbiE